ncbi:hypothetical protein OAA14_02550 [bacterium]|nr:hypothetical protein [bacterium]
MNTEVQPYPLLLRIIANVIVILALPLLLLLACVYHKVTKGYIP